MIFRSICLMLLGAMAYGFLLWVFGWRMPGRLRKKYRQVDVKYNNRKIWIILGYFVLLGIIIVFGFLFTKYMVRGDL
ncbi:MAG: hypothetical protein GX129_00180 [Clostridiales bacterium]|nr:hypothetical protein [Clostridiales bacterium]